MEEVYKNELDIMRLRHNEANSEALFDDHKNTWKYFLSNLEDLQMRPKNWPHYVFTCLCQVSFYESHP